MKPSDPHPPLSRKLLFVAAAHKMALGFLCIVTMQRHLLGSLIKVGKQELLLGQSFWGERKNALVALLLLRLAPIKSPSTKNQEHHIEAIRQGTEFF